MTNMKNTGNYKSNLELCSSNLMKLINDMPQQAMSEVNFQNTQNGIMINPCFIWNWIRDELVGRCCGNKEGILDFLCKILKEILCSGIVENCELRKELIRALKLCECLAQAIKQVNCNDKLENLVGRLFCLLVRIILAVRAIIDKIIILLIFCRDNKCGCNDKKVLSSFCKCLICDLGKELDELEELIDELNKLSIMFITCGAKQCKCKEHHCDNSYNNDYNNSYNDDNDNYWNEIEYYESNQNNQEYIVYENNQNYDNKPCSCQKNYNENQCKKNKPCR